MIVVFLVFRFGFFNWDVIGEKYFFRVGFWGLFFFGLEFFLLRLRMLWIVKEWIGDECFIGGKGLDWGIVK